MPISASKSASFSFMLEKFESESENIISSFEQVPEKYLKHIFQEDSMLFHKPIELIKENVRSNNIEETQKKSMSFMNSPQKQEDRKISKFARKIMQKFEQIKVPFSELQKQDRDWQNLSLQDLQELQIKNEKNAKINGYPQDFGSEDEEREEISDLRTEKKKFVSNNQYFDYAPKKQNPLKRKVQVSIH